MLSSSCLIQSMVLQVRLRAMQIYNKVVNIVPEHHYWNLAFFCVCENTQKNTNTIRKNIFSDGVPSEKYPHKYNERKIQLFCVFAVRNNFSVGVTRTEKLR